MRATEEIPIGFDAVPYYFATAMFAFRRQHMDGAFEAIEHMSLPGRDHVEREMVIVAADFTLSHGCFAFRLLDLLPMRLSRIV